MVRPETKYRVQGLAGLFFTRPQCRPGASQQFIAPALEETSIGFHAFRTSDQGLGIRWQRSRPTSLAVVVIGDEMKESALHEIAKPAPLWVGPAKITVNQLQCKFLKYIINSVRTRKKLAQVAANRAGVSLEQELAGGI